MTEKVKERSELSGNFVQEVVSISYEILREQASLNDRYNPEWMKLYAADNIGYHIADELTEMNSEISFAWKIFGKTNSDFAKALEEFIDVVHFSATKQLLTAHQNNKDIVSCSCYIPEDKATLILALNDINDINRGDGHFGHLPKFQRLIACGCVFFSLTPSQMLVAYLHKNKKNHARVDLGAATSEIDKSSELPTYEYLFKNSFVTQSAGEFNKSLSNFKNRYAML